MKKYTTFLTLAILVIACSSNEIGNSKDVNPQTVYIDYSVEHEENNPTVSCIAQFRFAGKNGTTLILNEPAKIELDGKKMQLDSSSSSGAFYSLSENVTAFEGKHELIYTDAANKVYHQQFTFHPLNLKSTIANNLSKKQNLIIGFSDQNENNVIAISIEDTAQKTENIDKMDTIKNGHIIIQNFLKLGGSAV